MLCMYLLSTIQEAAIFTSHLQELVSNANAYEGNAENDLKYSKVV